MLAEIITEHELASLTVIADWQEHQRVWAKF